MINDIVDRIDEYNREQKRKDFLKVQDTIESAKTKEQADVAANMAKNFIKMYGDENLDPISKIARKLIKLSGKAANILGIE